MKPVARFDVYANPVAEEHAVTPYLLDLQNDHLSGLSSRVVAPLRNEKVFGPRARRLNPLFDVRGTSVVLDVAALGAVPLAELRRPIADLRAHQFEIVDALDMLFGAF